ncbi:MAG: lanthionine synthetase LanC family protein, partial [Longimicrobiales bacterium]
LSLADAIPHADRIGLFSGWSGITLVAARVARILGAAEVHERAAHLMRRILDEPRDDAGFDLIAGRAGAIIALLALHELLDDVAPFDAAVCLGDELIRSAERATAEAGCSWRSAAYPRWRNLTGYSHGTAGAAHALLELFAATREARFLDMARNAFAYERHWFDSEAGNWPDLRETTRRRGRPALPPKFVSFWCHGAPGIALSRLRAFEILADPALEAEARIALGTTRRTLEDALRSGLGNFSLCHGIAGNAEVLSCGCQLPGIDAADDHERAVEAARLGQRLYDTTGQPWPCGTHAGETPNLMLGLAGIGRFYLRLAEPSLPSMLVLRPGEATR